MATGVARGDIWLCRFREPDKRRPVLVLSRPAAIEVLEWIIVAPISSTIHGAPSEILVDEKQGLKQPSAVKLDNVQTIRKSALHRYVGHLDDELMEKVCRALAIATGCS